MPQLCARSPSSAVRARLCYLRRCFSRCACPCRWLSRSVTVCVHWQCGACVWCVCVQCPFFVVHALSLSLFVSASPSIHGRVSSTVLTAGTLKEKPNRTPEIGSSGRGHVHSSVSSRALLQWLPNGADGCRGPMSNASAAAARSRCQVLGCSACSPSSE